MKQLLCLDTDMILIEFLSFTMIIYYKHNPVNIQDVALNKVESLYSCPSRLLWYWGFFIGDSVFGS